MSDPSDTELLDRWRQGNARAGGQLARRHFVSIRTYFVTKVPFAQRLLIDALRHLELRDQELLELYYWQDLSAREIGEHQGVLESTVRSRVRAALERLTRRYTELSQQPHERELDPQDLEDLLVELRTPLGC